MCYRQGPLCMDFEIESDILKALLLGECDGKYPAGIGISFRRRIRSISDAPDTRTFSQLRSWNYEKLKGNRSHQCSIRLNKQYRLIVEIEDQVVVVKGIEDYH